MTAEAYINHPTFGLLLMICPLDQNREIFTTLYAHRLFFLVIHGDNGMTFEPIGRSDARSLVEGRLRTLRRMGSSAELDLLRLTHKRIFQ